MKYDNTTYYTVPGKNNYTQITDNLIANPPVLEEGYKSVIWENSAVKEINKYDENGIIILILQIYLVGQELKRN